MVVNSGNNSLSLIKFKKDATEKQVIKITKIGIVISVAFAVVLSLFFESIVDMWYYIGTIGISAMIVPILIGFFYKGKKSGTAAVLSMISGFLTALIWVIHGYMNAEYGWPVYLGGIEPLYPVATTCLSRTMTAPAGLDKQVDLVAATFARIMKYSSQLGLCFGQLDILQVLVLYIC